LREELKWYPVHSAEIAGEGVGERGPGDGFATFVDRHPATIRPSNNSEAVSRILTDPS
jgi:hypothetical protein